MMNKKLVAIILALAVGLTVIGVGIFIHFKNKASADDLSYSSVEMLPEDMLFSENSNKPNIELILDEEMFVKAFGKKATVFDFKKADRIRVHFSNGEKFELEPDDETVKVTKADDEVRIKIYTDNKEIYENVNDTIRFDTSCSVKLFFDEGTFTIDDDVSRAVTFILKADSKPVSDIQEAYLSVSYKNLVLRLSLTDSFGKDIYFSSSGTTKKTLDVYTDKKDKHSFNKNIVTTELFKTAILNPSKSFPAETTINICVPDGFFVNSQGNRIKVVDIRNSDKNFRLVTEAELTTTTTTAAEGSVSTTTAGDPVVLTESNYVYALPTFEKEFPLATGELYRNMTDLEVVIPTNAEWNQPDFTGKIITSDSEYDIPLSAVVAMEARTLNGYVVYISVDEMHTSQLGGADIRGILFEGSGICDVQLTATDSEGNVIANISCPIEY